MNWTGKRIKWYPLLLIVLLFACASCGKKDVPEEPTPPDDTVEEPAAEHIVEAEATTMSLMKLAGTVGVTDSDKKDITPFENMQLYSGYHLKTQPVSYAWINLDHVKLAKMDENSEVGIQKEGKDLTIFLSAGGLYFNIAEPLPEDETLNIRCSSMIVGIRGTCGWVQLVEPNHVQVHLLEGTVECQITDGSGQVETVTVSGGEMADLIVHEDGQAEAIVLPFTESYVAPYVLEELEADKELCETVLEVSGLDILNPPDPVERLRSGYQQILDEHPVYDKYSTSGVSYAAYYDFNHDGKDELLIVSSEEETDALHGLEVYSDQQGYAHKLGEVEFASGDYEFEEYRPYIYNPSLVTNEDRTYFCVEGNVQDNWWYDYYTFEDGTLKLLGSKDSQNDDYTEADRGDMSAFGDSSKYTVLRGDELPPNICPELPDDVQRKNAFMDKLGYGTEYAKLIDMNRDGVEDLLVKGTDYEYSSHLTFYVYSWSNNGVQSISLETSSSLDNYDLFHPETTALYREKATGEIYIRYECIVGAAGTDYHFVGCSGSVDYGIEAFHSDWLDSNVDVDAARAEHEADEQSVLNEMNERFELIEEIPNREAGIATVEEVKQCLLER